MLTTVLSYYQTCTFPLTLHAHYSFVEIKETTPYCECTFSWVHRSIGCPCSLHLKMKPSPGKVGYNLHGPLAMQLMNMIGIAFHVSTKPLHIHLLGEKFHKQSLVQNQQNFTSEHRCTLATWNAHCVSLVNGS